MNGYKKSLIKKIIFIVLTAFCISFIFMQSLKPATQSSQESGRVLEILNNITEFLGFGSVFTSAVVRKFAHFMEFAVLSGCSFGMYKSFLNKFLSVVLLTASTYTLVAITDECIQLFSAGRACQFTDVVIDFCGGSVALLIATIVLFFMNKSKVKEGYKE